MESILMNKGTGIVASVPSDSPIDYLQLKHIKNNISNLIKEYKPNYDNLDINNYNPVQIINIEGMGQFPLEDVLNNLKITSIKDIKKIELAKQKLYSLGFYSGKMLVGEYSGQEILKVKELIKKSLIASNYLISYYEPESEVISRTGDRCIVALVDQWYLTYGENKWKTDIMNYVLSSKFKTYNKNVLNVIITIYLLYNYILTLLEFN